MADIFISYANEDRETAARFAQLLESAGWRVWWDRRIPAGRTWRSILEQALQDMRCMVVLWSEHSVQSPWVTEEAEEARRLGKTIVPVLIARVEPPIGFRTIQAADLARWNGSVDDPAAQLFLADLKSVLDGGPTQPVEEHQDRGGFQSETDRSSNRSDRQRSKIVFACAGVLAIFAIAAAWQFWPAGRNSEPPFEETSKEPPAPRLVSLAIKGVNKELKPNETVRLAVSGKHPDGTESEIKENIQWSSSMPQVATISKDGELTAVQAGSSNISAKIGDLVSGEWTVNVTPKQPDPKPAPAVRLVGLRISASKHEVFTNGKVSLRVRGHYSDNSEQILASGFEWQVNDSSLASVDRAGELAGLSPGTVEVVARAGEVRSPPFVIHIKETPNIKPPVVKPQKPYETTPPRAAVLGEQGKAKIQAYIERAEFYRGEGNYGAALAELEKAKTIDAQNQEINQAVEQTRRACNAERVLGNKPNC